MPIMPTPWFTSQSIGTRIQYGLQNGSESWILPLAENERQLGMFKLPPFQRPHVWTVEQDTAFVESIWDGLPLGTYVMNVSDGRNPAVVTCDHWLLDGQQRWTALNRYVADEFPVYGHLWSALPDVDQRNFRGRQFGKVEITDLSPERCLEVYNKLAYGGTAHTPENYPTP